MVEKHKSKDKIRVTFSLPAEPGEEIVYLVGSMNEWSERATPMKRTRDGAWEVKLDLEPNRRYEYRYLVNDNMWRNDPAADEYIRNPFGSENSVVSTEVPATATPAHKRSTKTRKAAE